MLTLEKSAKQNNTESALAVPLNLMRLGCLSVTDFYIALILFSIMFAIGRQIAVPCVVGTFHDDGVYVSTAKALAENSGYRLINFPGDPWQTKYPIVYPLVLSSIWRLCPQFPANVELMQCLSAACAALFVGLTYLFLVRFEYVSRPAALGASALCLTVPGFVFFSGQVLSEMPFALSLVLALWHLESYLEAKTDSKGSGIALGVSLSLPFLLRSIGLAVPLAALVCLLLNRRSYKMTGITVAAIALIAVVAPAIYGSSAAGSAEVDQVQSYQTSYFDWWKRNGLTTEWSVVAKNLQELPGSTGKSLVCGVFRYGESLSQNFELKCFCLLLGLSAWLVLLKNDLRRRSVSLFLWAYTLIVLLWPWPPFRFIIPILPLLYAMIIEPVWKTANRFPIAGILAVPILVIALGTNIGATTELISFTKRTQMPVMSVPRKDVYWLQFQETMDWVKTHTKTSDCMASTYDSLTFLYTGRKCVRPYELDVTASFYGKGGSILGTQDELLSRLKRYGVRYLIITPQPNYAEEALAYQLAERFEQLHSKYVSTEFFSADNRFKVLKIDCRLYEKATVFDGSL